MLDAFGTVLSVAIVVILALAGLGVLVFYGIYWTVQVWENRWDDLP